MIDINYFSAKSNLVISKEMFLVPVITFPVKDFLNDFLIVFSNL